MNTVRDTRFWDRSARRYAAAPVADQDAYARTLDRTRVLLRPEHHVVELGCGTGSAAGTLAKFVRSYQATDISGEMIRIASDRHATSPVAGLEFQAATAEQLLNEAVRADVIIGFNYLHLVRDLPGALRSVYGMLGEQGVFVSKTPCLGNMNPIIRWALLPAMRAVGMAPFAGSFTTAGLCEALVFAGFEVLSVENHASNRDDHRPFIVARRT